MGQVYPIPEGHDPFAYTLALENLEAMWPNFLATEITSAVIAGTVLDRNQVDRLRAALRLPDVTVVLISGPAQLRAARIRKRDTGSLRDDFLARTDSVARQIEESRIHDLKVVNDLGSPHALALDILERAGWSGPADGSR